MANHDICRVLGILGGLGPMATVYFYEMLTAHTKANCDQEHIDMLISSRATTPDRTAFIVGASGESPIGAMIEEGRRLQNCGADLISMPCNTAHYFYDELTEALDIPVLNILYETAAHLKRTGAKTAGILATEGTVKSGAYAHVCEKVGLDCIVPDDEHQAILSDIIYGQIKQGKPVDMAKFEQVRDHMTSRGADRLVLGCTELSLIKRDHQIGAGFVDAMEVLAQQSVLVCGKPLKQEYRCLITK
jgi:aspartate racemase